MSFFCNSGVSERFRELSGSIHSAPIPPIRGYGAAPNFRLADSIVIRGMDDIGYLRKTVSAEINLYRSLKPDVIVTENQFSSAISSTVASVPLVTTAASVNLVSFSSPLYREAESIIGVERNFNIIRKEYGLAEISTITELYHGGSMINLAPTLYEIEPELSQLPNILYVGPLLDSSTEIGPLPKEFEKSTNASAVYVYMSVGTLAPNEYVPILCEISESTGIVFIVALREREYQGNGLPHKIGSVHLFETVPGLITIKLCAVVITRGGQNTLMGCILAQRPVLGFPGRSAEADFNLRSVKGFLEIARYPTADFSSARLENLIAEATRRSTSPEYAILAKKLRSAGGARAVLDAIERSVA